MTSKISEKTRRRNKKLQKKKAHIQRRLKRRNWKAQEKPMFRAKNIQYDISDKMRAIDAGGIGLIHKMVLKLGLVKAINKNLELLKVHLPYHESDHVLNIVYNILSGGTCLEDIELRRNDEVYLDALGAETIPDPTTEGDFCRRFEETDIETLMNVFNETRLKVWSMQPKSFFEEAIIDGDGTLAETTGECKEGMDLSYKGIWGYHPLLISLANTQEPLYLVNRSGNRPSYEGAYKYFDRAIELCRKAGFQKITLRGDTDFSQSKHLDRWHEQGVEFVFGTGGWPNLVKIADSIEESEWKPLERAEKYKVKTLPRKKPENVKERIIIEREYKNLKLQSEEIAEFEYSPTKCKNTYRMVVLRKNISVEKGENLLFDNIKYFFYITNKKVKAREIVFSSNKRCNQENLIEQLKNGVRALKMPVDNLVSNWAYMVMASLAWSLKAWFALYLPEKGRWKKKHKKEKNEVLRMEFKKFVNAFVRIPAQLVITGRRLIFRLLAYNPFQHIFLRAVDTITRPLRC